MKFLTDLLNKLFGLGGKAQLIILVISHTVALVLGLMIGIVFAKPTIIINKDNQHNEQVDDEVIWGGDKVGPSSPLSRSGSYNPTWEDNEYRTQLLLFMPPSPSI